MVAHSTHDLISMELGSPSRSAENREATTMGAVAVLVARNDSTRLALVITNLGATAVFIRPVRNATSTTGFRLGPNGGFMSLNWKDDYSLVTKDFFGIDPTGASEIWVSEELIEAGEVAF